MSSDWLKSAKKNLKVIKELKPKDRLAHNEALLEILNAMLFSLKGWHEWITNPQIMNATSEEEFKELFKEMRSKCLDWLEYDIQFTGDKWEKEKKQMVLKNPDSKAIADKISKYVS